MHVYNKRYFKIAQKKDRHYYKNEYSICVRN